VIADSLAVIPKLLARSPALVAVRSNLLARSPALVATRPKLLARSPALVAVRSKLLARSPALVAMRPNLLRVLARLAAGSAGFPRALLAFHAVGATSTPIPGEPLPAQHHRTGGFAVKLGVEQDRGLRRETGR
jgi:hypothetical protein